MAEVNSKGSSQDFSSSGGGGSKDASVHSEQSFEGLDRFDFPGDAEQSDS